MKTCKAKTKQGGHPCKRPAGAGTDHLGEGRCKHHGGATPFKHGQNIKDPEVRKLRQLPFIEEARKLTMEDDILAVRACQLIMIQRKMEKGGKDATLTDDEMKILSEFAEKANRMDYRRNKLLQDHRALLSLEEVTKMLTTFLTALIQAGIIKPGKETELVKIAEQYRLVEVGTVNAS